MLKRLSVAAGLLGCVVGVGAVVAGAPSDSANDWPQWHGRNRDNISKETGLLQDWPKGGPPLAWKIKTVGEGFSSVALANGKIYTAGDEGGDCFAFALNEADGSQAWKSKLGRSGGDHPGPRATPTVDGERVYMMGQHGDVVCYSAADGKEVWRKNLNKDFKGHMMSGWGNSESLLVDGENLICTPGGRDGTMMALNKASGAPVWRSKEFKDDAAYASPIAIDLGGVHQIIAFTDASVAGIGAADGKLLWRVGRGGSTAVVPTPLVKMEGTDTAYVYVTSGYGVGCDLFKVTHAAGKFSVAPQYTKNKTMVNHHGGVILLGDYVYGYSDGKGWTCQDLLKGDAKWKEKSALGKGTISYADGRLYCREERGGKIMLIEATPEGWKAHGTLQQPDQSGTEMWPHLVIANGKMYVRDQETLLCYEVKGK
jgi:outer membrane protein assembly factor BamB